MADSKWITGLSPDMPLQVGGWRVLDVRLRAVEHYLPLAIERPHRDVEHVHRLRVATRRSRAALDLFADCLPGREFRRLRRELRRIRQAAGDARDADVFLLTLEQAVKAAMPEQLPGLHWLAGQVACRRAWAQDELRQDCSLSDFQRVLRESLAALRPPEPRAETPQTLDGLGQSRVLALLDHLEQLGHGDLSNEQHLHQIRIEGKHLRYVLEALAECLPAEFRAELYPLVEEMQEILGNVNDSHVASERVAAMRDMARRFWPLLYRDWRPGVDALLRWHRRQLARERRRFGAFWNRWRKGRVRERFGALLQTPARTEAADSPVAPAVTP